MRSAAELASDLRRLGVRAGDTLMLHVSLRAIGPVEGKAGAVVDAIEGAIGDDGTLLMILGAEIELDWVNTLPESERWLLLDDAPPFDPLDAPVLPEVGYFAEFFRRQGGTLVTDNPSGRFAARGRFARDLLADAPWHDYYGPGSPLDRLCRMGGRILRIGASPDTTTVLHWAEYRADVREKKRVRRHYRCRGAEGPETRVVECLDDEHGIVAWEGEDYFAIILREYLATGRVRQSLVGSAWSELIEANDLVAFGTVWMSEHLGRPVRRA